MMIHSDAVNLAAWAKAPTGPQMPVHAVTQREGKKRMDGSLVIQALGERKYFKPCPFIVAVTDLNRA